MTDTNFKSLYSRFLNANPNELHFAAHSHHFWPDVSREGQMLAWDDAARLNDNKWEHIFAHVIPKVQYHIARLLNLKNPQMIALASNTHELLVRVFSELLLRPKLKVLTTDSEFHSFGRQLKRWEEVHSQMTVTRLSPDLILKDRQTFIDQLKSEIKICDVVYLSQVFFNSGLCLTPLELEEIVKSAPQEVIIMIDGYHGFGAIETNLQNLEGRIFYLGGGYKYMQAGEGVGFMVVPEGSWRPVYTGWFAEYAHLSAPSKNAVGYSRDGMAFWGATMDPSGWYRFNAIWDQFEKLKISINDIHHHVRKLQLSFIDKKMPLLSSLKPLYSPSLPHHGHFLTLEASDATEAQSLRVELLRRDVYIDQRGARLRFGFGLYHSLEDIQDLSTRLF
ncbi:MAG: aminotransferase class V-fold PLP-dependent enzyme [Bacteriovoracaceae bacterium]|nr:aminotransferase class V-fold PLP-dependent enzyme [Bacteriovoracaceae bacterium]